MSRRSDAIESLPPAAVGSLRSLGEDLALARKRRKQSLRDWALRLDVSVPTLMKMEKGDPGVSAGVYATALWMLKRHEALADLAAPRHDLMALETEMQAASRRGAKSDA